MTSQFFVADEEGKKYELIKKKKIERKGKNGSPNSIRSQGSEDSEKGDPEKGENKGETVSYYIIINDKKYRVKKTNERIPRYYRKVKDAGEGSNRIKNIYYSIVYSINLELSNKTTILLSLRKLLSLHCTFVIKYIDSEEKSEDTLSTLRKHILLKLNDITTFISKYYKNVDQYITMTEENGKHLFKVIKSIKEKDQSAMSKDLDKWYQQGKEICEFLFTLGVEYGKHYHFLTNYMKSITEYAKNPTIERIEHCITCAMNLADFYIESILKCNGISE